MFSVLEIKKRLKLGEIVCDSLQLVEEINKIRKFEESKLGKKRAKLQHNDFLKKVREYNEISEEIGEGKISQSSYRNKQNKKQPKFLFTESQARIFVADESTLGKVMLNKFINNLQFENEFLLMSMQHTKETNDKLFEKIKEFKSEDIGQEFSKINSFINMTVAKRFGIKQGELKKENMTAEQLEFRAEVEELWIKHYKGSKGGIKHKIEKLLIS